MLKNKRSKREIAFVFVALLFILSSACTVKQSSSEKIAENPENYIEVYVKNIEISEDFSLINLKDRNSNLTLQIIVSRNQGELILAALHNASFPRPIAHDLIYSALKLADLNPVYVSVDELKGSTYYGSIAVETGEKEIKLIDSRPSDAIIFALKYNLPIFANKSLLEEHEKERIEKVLKGIEI